MISDRSTLTHTQTHTPTLLSHQVDAPAAPPAAPAERREPRALRLRQPPTRLARAARRREPRRERGARPLERRQRRRARALGGGERRVLVRVGAHARERDRVRRGAQQLVAGTLPRTLCGAGRRASYNRWRQSGVVAAQRGGQKRVWQRVWRQGRAGSQVQ
eukprot:7161144-Prymnesium_polylepis.1